MGQSRDSLYSRIVQSMSQFSATCDGKGVATDKTITVFGPNPRPCKTLVGIDDCVLDSELDLTS